MATATAASAAAVAAAVLSIRTVDADSGCDFVFLCSCLFLVCCFALSILYARRSFA